MQLMFLMQAFAASTLAAVAPVTTDTLIAFHHSTTVSWSRLLSSTSASWTKWPHPHPMASRECEKLWTTQQRDKDDEQRYCENT